MAYKRNGMIFTGQLYTDWYYSDGGVRDKLLKILEIEEDD